MPSKRMHYYRTCPELSRFVILPPAEQQPGMVIMSGILFSPEEGMARPTPFAPTPSDRTSEWLWIIVVQCRQPQGPVYGFPQPVISFPDRQPETIIVMHGLNGRQLHYLLQLWYSPTASSRGWPINRPIYHMPVGSEAKQWHGIVVVLKFSRPRRRGYSHASLNDLPDHAAYFVMCKSK